MYVCFFFFRTHYKYYFAPTSKQAVWIPVPQLIKAAVNKRNFDFRGGLHAASHALLNVVPL